MESNNPIIRKLDEFIRKYYKNRMIKGSMLTLAIIAAWFVVLILLEHFFFLPPWIRGFLFISFLAGAGVSTGFFIVMPFLKLQRIGKIITYEDAARIIGKHFTQIEDRLLNTLQLMRMKESGNGQVDLLTASIEQRIKSLKIFSFKSIIRFRANFRFLRYPIIPVIVVFIILVVAPGIISDPVQRYFHFTEKFEKPLPFRIEILNDKLEAMQQEDFTLQIKISGKEIPEEIMLKADGLTWLCNKENIGEYYYTFKSIQSDIEFTIVAGTFETNSYTLKVFPRPVLLSFNVSLHFPEYIGRTDETVTNSGDLSVPEGTTVKWIFFTHDVQSLKIKMEDEQTSLVPERENKFIFQKTMLEPERYSLYLKNAFVSDSDSLSYVITIIRDGYPSIRTEEFRDTSLLTHFFFRGEIKDDYGISKLFFHYEVIDPEKENTTVKQSILIPFNPDLNTQLFFYDIDLMSILNKSGQSLMYYFEVWDNDGIHGPKSAKTVTMEYLLPTLEEIANEIENNAIESEKELEESLKNTDQIRSDIEELNRNMIEKKDLDWLDRKKLEEMFNTNEKLYNKIEEIRKRNAKSIADEKRLMNVSERILEKQKQLNKLMEELLSDEIKIMLNEIKTQLENVDKKKLSNLLEKIKETNNDLEVELDRNLNLFKQIDFERKLEETVNELRNISEKQEQLSVETKKESSNIDSVKREQEKIENAYNELKNTLDTLSEKAKELENPPDLSLSKPTKTEIQQSLDRSTKNLSTGKKKAASENQKKASEGMSKLASDLQGMMMENEAGEMEEDLGDLRMILENLIRLSFEQEATISMTHVTNRNDPRFQEIIVKQRMISEQIKSVKDSLNSIARKQIFIQPIITKEIRNLEDNLKTASEQIENRNLQTATVQQQLAMTSMNNLANLLEESIKQMNSQMNMNSKGSSSCKMPKKKGGKASLKGIREMQEKMGEQLGKIKSGLEKMKNSSSTGNQEKSSINEQIARMAAMQEEIRNAMKEYQEKMLEEGIKDDGALNKTIGEMEETEKDLVNKKITQESLNRQQRILTRLLESEKAEQQREKEEKRESEEAKSQKSSNPKSLSPYNNIKSGETELLNLDVIPVKSYYKTLINQYLVKIAQ